MTFTYGSWEWDGDYPFQSRLGGHGLLLLFLLRVPEEGKSISTPIPSLCGSSLEILNPIILPCLCAPWFISVWYFIGQCGHKLYFVIFKGVKLKGLSNSFGASQWLESRFCTGQHREWRVDYLLGRILTHVTTNISPHLYSNWIF